MKYFHYISLPLLKRTLYKKEFLFFVFYFTINCTSAQSVVNRRQFILIQNTLSIERKAEVLHIKRTLLGKIDTYLFPVVKNKTTNLITQLVDENNDGAWDELLIEVTVKPDAKDTLTLSWSKTKTATKPFTGVRLSLKSKTASPSPEIVKEQRARGFTQNIADPYYQMEGPGIENDKVAFRAFFDSRNGKDIYGKIVDTPVLKQVGVTGTWHTLQPWGMDIFHTGNSLGAGGLAVKEANELYRLADADTSTFIKLYEGPLEAAFKLQFKNWDVGTHRQNGSETVRITKGDFFYKNEINVPLTSHQYLVSGIANFGIDQVEYTKHNSVFSSISTYGKQAEGTATNLGVAIFFPTNIYIENKTTATTDSIPNTSYVVMKPSKSNKQTIYFFAGWEQTDSHFSTPESFAAYLQETADKLAHPIQVSFINKR